MAPKRLAKYRRSHRPSKRASMGLSGGKPKGQEPFPHGCTQAHKVQKTRRSKKPPTVRLPANVANTIIAESQTALSMSTSTSSLVSNLRVEFLAELKRQFPNMPELDQQLVTAWCTEPREPPPIGHATSLPLKTRVQRGTAAYARHHRTTYDLNWRTNPGLSKFMNRKLVQPAVSGLLAFWEGVSSALLAADAAIQPRQSARIGSLASLRASQDSSSAAAMAPFMVQWHVDKQVFWSESPEAVLSQTQQMSHALAVWLRAQADYHSKSGAKAASELASMVPGLIDYLVSEGILSQGVVRGRVTELGADEDAAQEGVVTVSCSRQGAQLPPDIECRRLMDTLALNLSGASHDELFGSCLSLLGFVVFTARGGRLGGAVPV